MFEWIYNVPIWQLGLLLFGAMVALALLSSRYRDWIKRRLHGAEGALSEAQEGYLLTSVYTLSGLLIGFTFAMSIDRFDTRRQLVVQDAVAIQTLYNNAQELPEPHRARFSNLLIRYTDNHIQLAKAHKEDANSAQLLAANDALLTEIMTITLPAFQSIKGLDFSSTFVDSVNQVIDVDTMRKAARRAQIPPTIMGLLLFYTLVSAAVLGYVLSGRGGMPTGIALLALFALTFMLLSDINRPVTGTIRESQEPMERVLARLKNNPPEVYDRLSMKAQSTANSISAGQ
jgi:hypothetical protein